MATMINLDFNINDEVYVIVKDINWNNVTDKYGNMDVTNFLTNFTNEIKRCIHCSHIGEISINKNGINYHLSDLGVQEEPNYLYHTYEEAMQALIEEEIKEKIQKLSLLKEFIK